MGAVYPTRLSKGVMVAARIATVIVALWVLVAFPASAQEYQELPPDLEARAQALSRQLMCPICDGQTIGQSHSPIAKTMRDTVRERLAAGQSDQEIIDYFVASFGESILAEPPKRGVSLIAWGVPPVALLAGGLAVAFVVRSLRRSSAHRTFDDDAPEDAQPSRTSSVPDANLNGYLRIVDEELQR